ncbi:MAG: DinB family protein [Marmoricola sp.]|nr:DinB family protein [Marmoricola sp.]
MDVSALLTDHADRIADLYADALADLPVDLAHRRPGQGDGRSGAGGNPVVWLLWHTARVQDDHVAALAGAPQAWRDWEARFALPLDSTDIGYGHTDEQVDLVQVEDLSLLAGYHRDVHALTRDYLAGCDEDELDRVVDEAWDPPVTVGVRLVSVVGDCLQHLGQAAYLRGLLSGA